MKKYFIVMVGFFLVEAIGLAESHDFRRVAEPELLQIKLMASSRKTETITSDYLQKKHLKYLDAVIESKGKFWFKKESTLRWEYTDPFKYIFVLKDGKFIIKDAEKINEFSLETNVVFREMIQLISGVVQGNLLQESKFVIEAFENDSRYLVKLIPRDKNLKEVLSQIEMFFNKQDLSVYRVKMVENDEDYTEITFINRKINEKIPEAIFTVH